MRVQSRAPFTLGPDEFAKIKVEASMRYHSFLFVGIVALQAGCRAHGVNGSDVKVTNGILAETGAYRSVVRIGAPDGRYCSATWIGTKTILTAGHCVTTEDAKLVA